jgi:hypothetical protein
MFPDGHLEPRNYLQVSTFTQKFSEERSLAAVIQQSEQIISRYTVRLPHRFKYVKNR